MLAIANYHYIREDFSAPFPSIFGVSPQQFRKQLEALATQGTFISQRELLKFRNQPFDRNYILISFDDGLREQYELAKPILDEMGIPFLFFINTSNFQERSVSLVHKIHLLRSQVSSEELLLALYAKGFPSLLPEEKNLAIQHYNYDLEETAVLKYLLNFKMQLSEQQAFINPLFSEFFDENSMASRLYFSENMLQELFRTDSLGSHSHQHLPLGQLVPQELQKELQQTQVFFKTNFGASASAISYPYGSREACTGIREAVAANGFKLGFSMERAVTPTLQKDALLISRFDCNDLPLGKNNLFPQQQLFQNPPQRKWHTYENSFNHQ